MSLSRWHPLQDMLTLRDTMNRLFDDSLFMPAQIGTGGTPLLDVVERDDELLVRASLSGFEPEEIDVQLQGDVVTIQGQVEKREEERKETYHLSELRRSAFRRTVRLPVPVRSDEARAGYRNGILTLHLPTAQEAIARRIQINGNSTGTRELELQANER